jgi:hypothetical protein
MLVRSLHAVEKAFGMLGEPQHERKIASDIKLPPFVLSPSKDSDRVFQQALYFDLLPAFARATCSDPRTQKMSQVTRSLDCPIKIRAHHVITNASAQWLRLIVETHVRLDIERMIVPHESYF